MWKEKVAGGGVSMLLEEGATDQAARCKLFSYLSSFILSTDLGYVHSLITFHCCIVDYQMVVLYCMYIITIGGEAQVPSLFYEDIKPTNCIHLL